ncbi:hypothetical protein KI810_16190 [Geobacter luticola]|uniref:Cytochrome c domain-containing protein n=1 Tax=Geomobilimonas luticola TaxID=1114878 RepID=A0ABS5SGV1_9BACT|nr:hypothetical protein [Geomobilimonas luticola]
MLAIAGCGGGGSDQPAVGINSSPAVQETTSGQSNYFTVTRDDYGLITPNFLYSTDNPVFWSLQANVAAHVVDPDTRCVIRIDVLKDQDGTMPSLSGRTFSFENTPLFPQFPGTFYVFNGQKSVYKKVEEGTITFSSGLAGHNVITGEFDVVLTDYDVKEGPAPRYRLQGTFGFAMGTYGPASPLPSHVYPPNGENTYLHCCSSCHSLSDYDEVPGKGSDLSQRGGELPVVYPGTIADHAGIYLDQKTMQELRIFLNAW